MKHLTATLQSIPEETGAIHSRQPIFSKMTWKDSVDLARHLVQMSAAAFQLGDYFQQPIFTEQSPGVILVSIDQVVKRLTSVRDAALSLGVDLSIFACTEARQAIGINCAMDPRDRKYLSGPTSFPGLHAYCGGLDAAISRALSYAPHADVVCFKSSIPDIPESRRFAEAIRAAHPEKQLAFGYSPNPNGRRWNELDHAVFEAELHSVGFDNYFFTQFGSVIFPRSPAGTHWALLDDALKTVSADIQYHAISNVISHV